MKCISILILTFIVLADISAQDKYFIYFVDKGPHENQLLKSNPENFGIPDEVLQRRKKKISNIDSLITLADIPIYSGYLSAIEKLDDIKIHHKIKWMNAVSVFVFNKSVIDSIKDLPFVKNVKPVKKIRFISTKQEKNIEPNTTIISAASTIYDYGPSYFQYDLSKIPTLHSEGINGEGVRIGLLDSGFNWDTHPSLRERTIIDEYDFVFNDTITKNQIGDIVNQDYHGTSVFSIIGGFDEGNIVGPAFNSSYILAKTEFLGSETHIEEDNFARAVEWMENIGVDVISSSVGYNQFDSGEGDYTYEDMNGNTTIVSRAYNFAFDRGIVTVTSAGNEGFMPWRYIIAPADAFNVIAAGGIDTSATSRYGSGSYGPTFDGRIKPDLLAKATSVYNARVFDRDYGFGSGTSFAAPIIAGIAAQLLSYYPHLDNVQVRRILLESGDRAQNPDNSFGYGLLSAVDAVNFPNIELTESRVRLYKSFIGNAVSNLRIHVQKNEDITESIMDQLSNNKYIINLTGYNDGDTLKIKFSFIDSSNTTRFIPQNDYFKYIYGTKNLYCRITNAINEDQSNIGMLNPYPNPFNEYTRIEFISKDADNARVEIFDILGRKVKTLFNAELSAGKNIFIWNGENDFGTKSSSGIYFCIINTGAEIFSKKIILIK